MTNSGAGASAHATDVANALREHIESVAPGDVGQFSAKDLGQTPAEFEQTIALLRDLETAGLVRLGKLEAHNSGNGTACIEFERLR